MAPKVIEKLKQKISNLDPKKVLEKACQKSSELYEKQYLLTLFIKQILDNSDSVNKAIDYAGTITDDSIDAGKFQRNLGKLLAVENAFISALDKFLGLACKKTSSAVLRKNAEAQFARIDKTRKAVFKAFCSALQTINNIASTLFKIIQGILDVVPDMVESTLPRIFGGLRNMGKSCLETIKNVAEVNDVICKTVDKIANVKAPAPTPVEKMAETPVAEPAVESAPEPEPESSVDEV